MKTCPHCGCDLRGAAPPAKRRSTPQHRRFFAAVRAAFDHWPANHEFRPSDPDHLRYWLETRAGHFTVTTTARIASMDPDKVYQLVRAFMRHSEDHRIFIELDGNLLVEKRTKSIDYDSLGPAEFGALKEAVCDIIENEVGVSVEQLLKETETAA